MKNVQDVTLTCGGTSLLAYFCAGGPADLAAAPVAAIGAGGGCSWFYVVHWSIW
jgi:hypothetical protein